MKEFTKYKYQHINEKCWTCEIRYKDYEFCLEYTNVKHDLIVYKCLCCNRYYQTMFGENFKKQIANTYKFSNHDINKFILVLQNGVYQYDYRNDWKKLDLCTHILGTNLKSLACFFVFS